MKKNLMVFAAIAVAVISMTSCKKDNDDTPATLAGQWNLQKDITWTTILGTPSKDTTVYDQGSYVNFAADGKVYSKYIESGAVGYDTSSYTISGTNLILLGGTSNDTLQIQSLTNNSVTLHAAATFPGGSYEYWQFLGR